jgi:GNAT superfamily N-acetyltransferase
MVTITEFSNPAELTDESLRERARQAKVLRSRQFVARENEVEVAYLSFDDRSDIDTGVLYEVLVLPHYRNRGLGKELIGFAERIACSIGCTRMRLSPRAFDTSVNQTWLESWYLTQGYSLANDGSSEFEKSLRAAPVTLNASGAKHLVTFHGPAVYADEQLSKAIRILAVGAGDVRSRLLDAYAAQFHPLQPSHFPEHLRKEFEWVMAQLTKRGPQMDSEGNVRKGSVENTLLRMQRNTGVRIAQKLLLLHDAVDRYVRTRGE